MKTAQERGKIKDAMQQTRLDLIHTQNCQVLPDRNVMLDLMPTGAKVAEIGVAFGDFSKEILQRCAPNVLYLIDAWSTKRYREGLKKIQEDYADLIADNKVIVRQGLSTEVLKDFEPDTLDWVYIDTNHSYATTLSELELCQKIIAPGGRIAGHDFCTGNVVDAIPYGVVEAVTKFCKDHKWQFEFLTVESRGHFSFCLKRI
ncbi:MAG: class I SAM-dependent methyltransferase [Paracoccaceae bacterium]